MDEGRTYGMPVVDTWWLAVHVFNCCYIKTPIAIVSHVLVITETRVLSF